MLSGLIGIVVAAAVLAAVSGMSVLIGKFTHPSDPTCDYCHAKLEHGRYCSKEHEELDYEAQAYSF